MSNVADRARLNSDRHSERTGPVELGQLAMIPERDTLVSAVAFWAETCPERPLVYSVDEDETLKVATARGLMDRAMVIAAGLRREGVGAGQAVLLAMDTSLEVVEAFLACMAIGATPCIVDLPLTKHRAASWRDKLAARVELIDARLIVANEKSLPMFDGVREVVARVVACDELASASAEGLEICATADGLAFVQFTSGTISAGRAIRLSNRAVMANLRSMAAQFQWREGDVLVSWLPLYHDLGLVANLLLSLAQGVPIVKMSPMQFLFQPSRLLWAVHHFRATAVFAPNFAYEMCVAKVGEADAEGLDLSSLRYTYNCAEFIHAKTLRRFSERFAKHGFDHATWTPAYGMAEVVVGASSRVPGEPLRVDRVSRGELFTRGRATPVGPESVEAMEIVSCGRMMPGYTVQILSPEGAPLPERTEGAIAISGPSLFDGYHREVEATAAVLRDGWLLTGDLGYCADGELYICGRSKDLIIKGGENYHPYVFEHAVAEIDGVRAGGVAAIGVVNDSTGTEDLNIVFETTEHEEKRLREMCSQVERHLQRRLNLKPDRVIPVAPRTIPKTTSGKIRRRALAQSLDGIDKLRALAQAIAPATVAPPVQP